LQTSASIVSLPSGKTLVSATTTELIPPPRVPDVGDRDKSMAAGLAWATGAKWTSQIVSWGSWLVVTRLLAPSDFGLVGMAGFSLGLLMIVTNVFGTAVTTLRDLTAEQLAQLNSVATISGFLACLVSCVLAIPLGHFFKLPHLPSVVFVMGLMFIVSGFRMVPYSLLYRDMRFRLLSIFDVTQTLAQALIMLALARLGFGFWALVLGNIICAPVVAALQISFRPCAFAWPRINALKDALTFGYHIMVSDISWYGYSNSDFLIAGRVLGQSALGAYTLAWTLATILLEKITAVVGNVSYVYLSAVQKDDAALRRYLRIITEGISLITFPATLGLGLVAHDFIQLVLGPKWEGAIAPLEILAFYASFRSIVAILPSILNVTGESRFVMRITQGALILMPVAFYSGSRWGPTGIAYGWVVAYPIIALCFYHRTFRRIKMPWRDYLGAVRPALTGCLIMAAAVEILRRAVTPNFPLPARFGLEVLAGGAAYILSLILIHGDRFMVFWNFFQAMRNPVPLNTDVQGISHV
jgi:O-antigen/teichoic acid export membrane protein